MKQEEVEHKTVEETVEKTYCDECGNDCTNNSFEQVQDVCPDCCDDGQVQRFLNGARSDVNNKEDWTILATIIFAAFTPFIAFFATVEVIFGSEEDINDMYLYLSGVLGTLAYGGFIVALLV